MKELTCEIIRDLIPLCAEGLCSEASKQAVETHIASCAACRRLYDEPPEEAAPVIVPGADAAMQRVNRKMKHNRGKIISLGIAAAAMAGLIGVLSAGQILKQDPVPSFETVWQTINVRPLVKMLAEGDYAGYVSHAGAGLQHSAALGSYLQLEQDKDIAMLQETCEAAFGDTAVDHIRIRSGYSGTVKEESRLVISYAEIFYRDGRELHLQLERDIDGLYRCEAVGSGGLTQETYDRLDKALGFIADHTLQSGWVLPAVMVNDTPFTEADLEQLERRCSMMVGHRFAPDCAERIAAQCRDFYLKGYTIRICDLSDVQYDKEQHRLCYRLYLTASDGQGTAMLCAEMPFDHEGLHPQTHAAVYRAGCTDALADDLQALFQ